MNPRPEAEAAPAAPVHPAAPKADGASRRLRAIVREPLVQFILLGAVIFLIVMGVRAAHRPTVHINSGDVEQLVQYWEIQSQRPPNKDELAGIIHDRVDEEVLAREAVRLGLDRDDLIIRRRLAQKMAFANEDLIQVKEPDGATLQAYYDRTKSHYVTPIHVTLRHAFFSADRRGPAAEADARRALATAQAGGSPGGDPFMLPTAYADVGLDDVSKDYGAEFAKMAETAPIGAWAGPVKSAYGWHILRIDARAPAKTKPFAEVKDEVHDAWMADQRKAANEAYMAKLRAKYRVVIDNAPARELTEPAD